VPTLTIEALPKQIDFLTAQARAVLYSGAFGAGKSRALCLKAYDRAQHKGAREGLCRKALVTLKATTLRTLLEPDGELPPVLPEGSYIHHKSDRVIELDGGGLIEYFGLEARKGEQPTKIGSLNLSGCGIDEATETSEKDWTALRGRIRTKVKGLPNQLYGACNPGPPSHYLARYFGLGAGNSKPKPGHIAVTTRTTDNFFLPPDYVADLQTYTGLAKARYVEGRWLGSDRLVYDTWVRDTFVQYRNGPMPGQPETQWRQVVFAVDEGYTNPAVILVLLVDGDGRVHVAHEWYETHVLPSGVVAEAKRLQAIWHPEICVVDPSAAGLIAEMQSEGLPAIPADNDRQTGVRRVRNRLKVAGDGRPRFTVDPTCENTIREFETWETKPDSDDFTKENDHAMDGVRYGIAEIDGGGGTLGVIQLA